MNRQSPTAAPVPGQRVAVEALSAALGDQVRVSTRKPENPGKTFVIVSRIGGTSTTFATSDPRFLLECYAPSELEAEEFCEQVASVWRRLRSRIIIHSYDDNNISYLEDPDSRYARFQFTGGLKIANI